MCFFMIQERLQLERVHSLRAIMDFEQVAALVGGGVPQTVHNRCIVRLESERMFCPGYMMVYYL